MAIGMSSPIAGIGEKDMNGQDDAKGRREKFERSIETYEKIVRLLSRWFSWIGFAGLLLMMLITCLEVVAAKIFVWPIPGSIEFVMLSQLVAIAFVASLTQIVGWHVRVEFFTAKLSRPAQALIDGIMSLFLLVFFALIVWRLYVYGNSLRAGEQVSPTAGIALYPFAYAISFACLLLCFVFVMEFLKSILEVIKK